MKKTRIIKSKKDYLICDICGCKGKEDLSAENSIIRDKKGDFCEVCWMYAKIDLCRKCKKRLKEMRCEDQEAQVNSRRKRAVDGDLSGL